MFEAPTLAELNIGLTLPVLSLAVGTCILLIIDLFVPKSRKDITAWLAVGILVFCFVVNLFVYNNGGEALFGAYVADPFSGFVNIIVLLTTFVTILLSMDYIKRTEMERGEFYSLLLFSAAGMMLMGSSNDLVAIFVALELLSIPLYVLSAFRQPDLKSEESGVKYFILGAFASAFFVYGSTLIYGATGTTSLPEIFAAVNGTIAGQGTSTFFLLAGSALVLVGLSFKIAVVPFHMWTPDVYEGAPTPVTAFMSVGAKVGGFAALLRILVVGLVTLTVQDGQTAAAWQNTVWIIAAVTLIFGNIVAISQSNIKRMLAYSSIAHAGYILMAVAAAGTSGVADRATQAALVYLLAYMFTNLGAFAVALAIEKDDGSGTDIENFVGLGKSRPMLALMMAIFMFSLTGIPLTGGFTGKWMVFQATLEAGLVPLAIIGVLTSVVSAFYYARIIINMYLRDGDGDPAAGSTRYVQWAAYIALAGTLTLGLFPSLITNLTEMVTLAANIAGR